MPTTMRTEYPRELTNTTVRWANSAAANTEVVVDLGVPGSVPRPAGAALLVIVRNPSSVTALAGESRVAFDDGGSEQQAKLASFTVARANGGGEGFLVDGGLLGRGGKIALRNSTVLGGSDGFTARVSVWSF